METQPGSRSQELMVFSFLSRNNKLVFVSLALWGVGEGMWWYLLPVYIEGLGANPVQIGFVLSVAMIAMTVMFIPSGWLSDRLPRRPVVIGGWFLGTAAILLLAIAPSWQMAIPGLVLYNLSAFNMPALNSYVTAEVKSGQDMRRIFTTVFSGFTLGMMFSPAVGGWVADVWGLRPLFFLAAGFFALSTVFILLVSDQPDHRVRSGSDGAGLRGNRMFLYLCLLLFFIHLAGHLGIPLASNFLRDERGLSMSVIGVFGSLNSFGSYVLVVALGRWPRSRTASLILAELAVAAYAAIMLFMSSVPLLGLALFLRGGLGAVRHLGGARLGEMMPPSSMGLGFGIFQTMINLAFTLSPYIAGWLYVAAPTYPFVASLILFVPAIALTIAVGAYGRAPAVK